MMKINQTYILILDFVNYFLIIEKENLGEWRERVRLKQLFKLVENTTQLQLLDLNGIRFIYYQIFSV